MSDRLTKLLNMLASDNDGERANAARMIADMAKKDGKLVSDFVGGTRVVYKDRIVEKTVYRDRPDDFRSGLKDRFEEHLTRGRAQTRRTTNDSLNPLLAALREARDRGDVLNSWEEEFVDDVLAAYEYDADLSPRQAQTAQKIKRKMERIDDPLL